MKATVLTTNLQKKLSLVNKAISTKTQLPVLANILLETRENKLRIASTDLEIGVEVMIPVIIEEEGATTVPAKAFTELINSLTEDKIQLIGQEGSLDVVTTKTKSTFQTMSKEEFPRLYEERGDLVITLPLTELQNELTNVVFAASQDTTRPALSGVLVKPEEKGLLLVATDGYRLSLKHYQTKETNDEITAPKQLLIPARVVKEIVSLKDETGEISLFVSPVNNQIIFVIEETLIIGRLLEATFPDYERIIPSDFSLKTTFDVSDMQKAVRICSIFAREAANIITLSVKKDRIIISSKTPNLGGNTVEIDATTTGEENEIAFNARYLQDLFNNLKQETIEFEMMGPLNPGVFHLKDDPSYLHLIMPIRTQE